MQKAGDWAWPAGVVALVTLLRFGLLDVPLERDEGEYAYTAWLMLEGFPPYSQAYNMKLPGVYVAYAAILSLLGDTPRDIHLGLLILNALTIVLVYVLGRRLYDELTGFAAAAAFGVLSVGGGVQGVWANAEAFVLPFALAGFLLMHLGYETARRRVFVLAGLSFGLALLMKQHGIFFGGAGALLLLVDALRAPAGARGAHLERIAWFVVALAVPYLSTCVVLWAAGVLDHFWFWTIDYARAYTGLIPVAEGPGRFWHRFLAVSSNGVVIWLVAALGLSALWWSASGRRQRAFVLVFVLGSFTSLVPGLYFRPHYFQLVLPAVGLLFGVGVRAIAEIAEGRVAGRRGRLLSIVAVAVSVAHALYVQRDFLFEQTPLEATRSVYGLSPFPESLVVADFLRASSEPNDRVAILGSEPQIPFYARRRKASGHLYLYPLMEDHAHVEQMQRDMIREIETSRPRFLVFVNTPTSWQRQPGSRMELLTWLDGYVRQFRLVARVEITRSGSRFLRADELSQDSSCASDCIDVFERPDP